MQPTNTQHQYKLINGDIHYDNYEINSEIRPLNLKSKADFIICYKDNFDFYSIILDKQHLFIHKNTNDKIKLKKKSFYIIVIILLNSILKSEKFNHN